MTRYNFVRSRRVFELIWQIQSQTVNNERVNERATIECAGRANTQIFENVLNQKKPLSVWPEFRFFENVSIQNKVRSACFHYWTTLKLSVSNERKVQLDTSRQLCVCLVLHAVQCVRRSPCPTIGFQVSTATLRLKVVTLLDRRGSKRWLTRPSRWVWIFRNSKHSPPAAHDTNMADPTSQSI